MVRENATVSIRPYWQVVPLQATTGRTFGPVPPVSRPCSARKAQNGSILANGMRYTSMVRRVVMAISPLPNFSAASTIARISSG